MVFLHLLIGSALAAVVLTEPALPLERSALIPENFLQDVSVPYPYQDYPVKRFTTLEPRNTYYTHDGYQAIIVPAAPAPTKLGFSVFGLLSLVASYTFAIVKKIIFTTITSIPAFFIGVVAVFGICKLTPICTKLSHWKSIEDAEIEIRSLATPERIARASDFVQNAIRKFSSMQKRGDDKDN